MNATQKNISLIFLFTCLATMNANADTNKKPGAEDHAREISYTRLDAKGKAVKAHSAARCVRDNTTGLVWELKTDDEGVQDKDNTYRWGGVGAEKKGEIFFEDWNSAVAAVNRNKLCGFADWRVPAIDELESLISTPQKNPAQQTPDHAQPTINTDYFPLTLPGPYWSASAYTNYPEHGQTVHFGNGTSYYYNGYRGNALPLRLVRGEHKSAQD